MTGRIYVHETDKEGIRHMQRLKMIPPGHYLQAFASDTYLGIVVLD